MHDMSLNLNTKQQKALLALGQISEGNEVFLNVLDADELVILGLADLFGKGQFVLTDNGWKELNLLRARLKLQ